MARDWSDTRAVRDDILARMARYGKNIADVPFSMSFEKRDSGYVWVVDIHVKVRRTIEFDISAEAETLGEALRKVYLGMNNEEHIRRYAEHTRNVFGLAAV